MLTLVQRLIRETEGQTMAEYALILVLVAVLLVGAFTGLKTAIATNLKRVEDGLGTK